MKVKSLAPWFGAKRVLAQRIVDALGPHRAYWEPFCGSMAVLLAKPQCTHETVNDLHGDLINLARVIQSDGARLYRRLRRTLFAEALCVEAKERLGQPFETSADRAYWFFVHSWFGRNGSAGSLGGKGFCVRYTANGGHAATRWASAVNSIPAWRRRMSNVTILNRDAFDLLERIDDTPQAAIYCDPPYLVKGERYVHDFAAEDHQRLADSLRRFRKSRVVVSYYRNPRLKELYPGWKMIDCPTTKALVNQGMRAKKGVTIAPEVLMVNDLGSNRLFS